MTAGELRPGDRVLLSAFGGGLTWGSTVLRWPELRVRLTNQEGDFHGHHCRPVVRAMLVASFGVETQEVSGRTRRSRHWTSTRSAIVEFALVVQKEFGVAIGDDELTAELTVTDAAVAHRAARRRRSDGGLRRRSGTSRSPGSAW